MGFTHDACGVVVAVDVAIPAGAPCFTRHGRGALRMTIAASSRTTTNAGTVKAKTTRVFRGAGRPRTPPGTCAIDSTGHACGSSQPRFPSASDEDLLLAAAAGDRRGLAALYDRHGRALLLLGQGMLRNRSDAEDVLHDVFIEVLRHAKDYGCRQGTVRSWLAMRVRSRALDRLKSVWHARRSPMQDETGRVRQLAARATDASVRADRIFLLQRLRAVPADQRMVLGLAYFHGLSQSEIALHLGLSLGTVKSRMARALSRLREAFDDATL